MWAADYHGDRWAAGVADSRHKYKSVIEKLKTRLTDAPDRRLGCKCKHITTKISCAAQGWMERCSNNLGLTNPSAAAVPHRGTEERRVLVFVMAGWCWTAFFFAGWCTPGESCALLSWFSPLWLLFCASISSTGAKRKITILLCTNPIEVFAASFVVK